MTIKLKGINTAPILSNNRFALMVLKIKDHDDLEHTLYLNAEMLIDLLILLRNRLLGVSERLAVRGDIYKAKLLAESERMVAHVPEVMLTEANQPDLNKMVTSFAPKRKEEDFTLIAVLQNEQILPVEIDDSQVEFIILAIQQALTKSGDNEAVQVVGSILDFLLFYTVDLSDLNNLQFRHIQHEKWKQDLFAHHLAVLYCFECEGSKKILAGSILKASAEPDTEALNHIIGRVVALSPGIKALSEKHSLCNVFTKIIPSQPNRVLTEDECLAPLHTFCLETQAALNL